MKLTLAFFIALLLGTANAADYYVSNTGDDDDPGSLSQPWQSLQHAVDSVNPGDTVWVRGGNYAGAHMTQSGTEQARIALRAFPGESPAIVSDNAFTPDGLNLEGASYVTVEGFRVDGRGRAGIRAVLCQHVTIRANITDLNSRWGIFTGFCDDLLIEANITSNSLIEHGIYVSNSADRPEVRNNLIFGNHANGIHFNGDASQGGDGIISDAIIEKNIIFDNGLGGGSGINLDGVQDSVVRNNLLYDSHASGISLYQIDGGGPSTGNKILNNTVLQDADGRWALNIQDGAINNQVSNNILYNHHPFRGSIDISTDSLSGLVSDHNVVMHRFTTDGGTTILDLTQWQMVTAQDSHSLIAVPTELFEDATSDFRLPDDSPAVDSGMPLAEVSDDLLGTMRPLGLEFDIGAYEGNDVLFVDGLGD